MKHTKISRRVKIVAALLAVGALITSVALAQTDSGASDPSTETTLSGGRYQLITTSAPMNPQASGGGYRLMLATPVADPASGCCCKTNLPCVRR